MPGSTLINPTQSAPQVAADFSAEPVFLRHPGTGMIFKLTHKDTIARCLKEGYQPSSERQMREQAVELAQLQGRPLPPSSWAAAEDGDSAKDDSAKAEKSDKADKAAGK